MEIDPKSTGGTPDTPGPWHSITTADWADFCRYADLACGKNLDSGNAFRGQSDSSWSLEPSLLRLATAANLSAPTVIDTENRITTEFASLAHLYGTTPPDAITGQIAWWPWMQHYGAPTRLLYWSMSPYVAAYFAVERDWHADGAVWGFAVNVLRNTMHEEFGGENATDDPRLAAFFSDAAAPAHVSVVSRTRFSDRMASQQACFTLGTQIPADRADAIGDSLRNQPGLAHTFKLIIPKDSKPDVLRRLRRMNVNARTLFPGTDGLGRSLAEMVRLTNTA